MIRRLLLLALLLACAPVGASAADGEYLQVAGLIDTRTTFSDGALTPDALADLARERGFEVLFYNDHDVLAMAYGVPPFRHVFRLKKQLPALRTTGPGGYLEAVAEAGRRHPDMILVPGSESVPYYYWTGSFIGRDLTCNDHEKRILAVGLDKASDYTEMPVIHNKATTRYLKRYMPMLMMLAGALLLGVYVATWGQWYRWAGAGISLLALLLMANALPFRSSPYHQYMGDLGIAPYQKYIDYVDARGGMTFWNYPETLSGVREYGPIRLNTPPYPDALLEARHYTGFSAVYGDTITITEPGRVWDQVLTQYCRGERQRPVWGIATADFHADGESGERLGNFPTVFLVKEKNRAAVLAAMGGGRMYAVRGNWPQRLVLSEFSLEEAGGGRYVMGDEAVVAGPPRIHVAVSLKAPADAAATITLIRGGAVVSTITGPLPLAETLIDEKCPAGEKTFYRLMVAAGAAGRLAANPIFVTRR